MFHRRHVLPLAILVGCVAPRDSGLATVDCSEEPVTCEQLRARVAAALTLLDDSIETVIVRLPHRVSDAFADLPARDRSEAIFDCTAGGRLQFGAYDDRWIPGQPFALRLHRGAGGETAFDLVYQLASGCPPYSYLEALVECDLRTAGIPFVWYMSMSDSVFVPRAHLARARALLRRRPELAEIMRRVEEAGR